MEQELLTLSEHPSSPSVFLCVRVDKFVVFCVMFLLFVLLPPFFLVIVLSVLPFTTSDYTFGIVGLFYKYFDIEVRGLGHGWIMMAHCLSLMYNQDYM